MYAFGRTWRQRIARYTPLQQADQDDAEAILKPDSPGLQRRVSSDLSLHDSETMQQSQVLSMRSVKQTLPPLTIRETARLSLEFCLLWFLANYFVAACLEHTTVASSTILTSTSSIFTLMFGTLFRVEKFTLKKLFGIVASLAGIALVATSDLKGDSDKDRGSFPHKSFSEVALGNGMALISAILYGMYAVMMKKRIGDESRINMPLFFGLVGLCNVLVLWPGFFILHYTGVEKFELPEEAWVIWVIVVSHCLPTHFPKTRLGKNTNTTQINSLSSLISDIAWAYAVLLTSPIVVTVGLSTTIPLAIVGQIVLNSQHASIVYWLGAGIVLLSFFFVNHEEAKEEEENLQEQGLALDEELLLQHDGDGNTGAVAPAQEQGSSLTVDAPAGRS